jgi:hypothetical protein
MAEFEEYYVDFYPIDQIPQELIDQIRADYRATQNESGTLNEIYEEQLLYIGTKNPKSYFVAAYHQPGKYLGGVILFLDVRIPGKDEIVIDAPSPAFQGIAKSILGLQDPAKLNSLLMPAIIDFLKPLGYHRIFVNPLPNQRDILLKHYNFKRLKDTVPTIVDEIGVDMSVYYKSPVLVHTF